MSFCLGVRFERERFERADRRDEELVESREELEEEVGELLGEGGREGVARTGGEEENVNGVVPDVRVVTVGTVIGELLERLLGGCKCEF